MASNWSDPNYLKDMRARTASNRASDEELDNRFGVGYAAANTKNNSWSDPNFKPAGQTLSTQGVAAQMPKVQGAVPAATKNATTGMSWEDSLKHFSSAGGANDFKAEQDRVEGLISTGQAPDMAKAREWQAKLQGITPQAAQPTPQTQGAIPNQISQGSIQQEAGYKIDKERSDLKTAVTKRLEQLRNNANYSNKLIQDNRALEDFDRENKVNPFSGRTRYEDGLISRGRDIDDTFRGANLDSELNAVSQDLYNFDKLAPDKQNALMNEMTRIERDYGLQVGQLTGNLNGQRTLAGQAQDYAQNPNNPANVGQNLNNQIAQLKLTNLPAEIKMNLEGMEQDLKTGKINQETAQYQLEQYQDPNSPLNRSQALDLKMKELEAANLPEAQRLELQKLRKTIAEIGKVPPKSDYETKMNQIKLDTAQLELDRLQNPELETEKQITAEEYQKNIVKPQLEPYTGRVLNAQPIEDQIILSGMSEYEQYKAYLMNGLPWEDPIPQR